LKSFLASAKFKPITYLSYPYQDSIAFFELLKSRLFETGIVTGDSTDWDTTRFIAAIKKYQKKKGLRITGHLSDEFVDALNNTDVVKFKRIAVNLDRYKQLSDTLPHTYIWVNLPSFTLDVIDDDTVSFESRIIVGDPKTRTPLLTSQVSNFITYPQWTVPYSIIFKEMLPKIQQNIDFLKKENLMVVDKDDNIVDPKKIKWSKLSKKHFPYFLKQQQGDNNSLGVIKFNFRNKYSVYMHDTNVRWMFGKAFRALSHGCVRVKEWQKISDFLVRNDTIRYHPDTLRAWIKRQEKHVVSGFQRVPIYIRYFDCEGKNGRIRFYDDIYEEDRLLREKYFADKSVY
ncbi:MAG TPA: L,D-transpeptidase family protein, partial [Puia sp.]|nr:L,D-transpeptidase family protein [Puia sp.]